MIHTLTLNPAVDKTAHISHFTIDQVNKIEDLRMDAAGKGINVSKVLAAFGTPSTAWCILAGETGRFVESALSRADISHQALFVEGATRTNLKIVDSVMNTHTDINEAGPVVSPDEVGEFVDRLSMQLNAGDYVVVAGSLPRGLADDTYRLIVDTLRKHGARVFLDADGAKLQQGIEAHPYCIKPNNYELAELCGADPLDRSALIRAARDIAKSGVELVVVSLGGDGVLFVPRAERAFFVPACRVSVASTVGAGDSVVAALVHGFSQDWDLEETACFSQATGAASVMQAGTQAPPLTLVEQLKGTLSVEYLSE